MNTAGEPTPDTVLWARSGPVVVLTLNRPDRLNAMTSAMEESYSERLSEADADPEIRAIVVTGAGRGFCAGADLEDVAAVGAASSSGQNVTQTLVDRSRPKSYPSHLSTPVIAAVHGACAGLGLVTALWADIRFTTPDAKWTTAFTRRGLIAEHGCSWLLPRLVGLGRALDLLLSARVVTGVEAYQMGLAERLIEDGGVVDAAVEYATDLATHCSATAVAVAKRQIWAHLDFELDGALTDSNALMLRSFEWPDVAEGVASFVERRAPKFPPLNRAVVDERDTSGDIVPGGPLGSPLEAPR